MTTAHDLGCIIGQSSTRTCERGTNGCDVRHGDARECFSTKDGHWQDRADLEAENAKLIRQGSELRDCLDAAVAQRDKLRAELAELRKQAEAAAAAPSEAEVEAWRTGAIGELDTLHKSPCWTTRGDLAKSIDEAVSLMRRAQRAAPPQPTSAQQPDGELQKLLDAYRMWSTAYSVGDLERGATFRLIEALARKAGAK